MEYLAYCIELRRVSCGDHAYPSKMIDEIIYLYGRLLLSLVYIKHHAMTRVI